MDAYEARFYDAYFTGLEGEVEFYVAEALDVGGPVLELGCGTGRVLLPMARAGVEVTGLDRSRPLLEVLRAKLAAEGEATRARVHVVEADMADFALGRRFEAVFIPYRTFQHLLDPLEQQRALERIGEHLVAGGRLVFNTFDPLAELAREGLEAPLRKDADCAAPQEGHRLCVYYARRADPQVQVLEQEILFEEFDQSGRSLERRLCRLRLRWTPQFEMAYLLERSGFELEALYGDFAGAPYPGYGEQVWVARRP